MTTTRARCFPLGRSVHEMLAARDEEILRLRAELATVKVERDAARTELAAAPGSPDSRRFPPQEPPRKP